MNVRLSATVHVMSLMALGACGCSSSDGVSSVDREAWHDWASGFVSDVCAHQERCDGPQGAACIETGMEWADNTTCDAAVEFYLAHREELEACIKPFPSSCDVDADEACPSTAGAGFYELCQ